MNVPIKPELERFVDEQVKAGRFGSHAEALEAGIARLMLDPEPDELSATEIVHLRTSVDEMRRGEVVDWNEHSTALREKYDGR